MINYQFSKKFKLLENVKLNYLIIILTLTLTCGLRLPLKLLRNEKFNHLTIILTLPSRVGPDSPLMNKTQETSKSIALASTMKWSSTGNPFYNSSLFLLLPLIPMPLGALCRVFFILPVISTRSR